MATKALPVHHDLLGRLISEDDIVAFSDHNRLTIGRVIRMTAKQIRVVPLMGKGWRADDGYLKYSTQCVQVGGPELTLWILKNS